MATQRTEATDPAESDRRTETERLPRAKRALSTMRRRGLTGRTPLVAGGLLLARAARTASRDRRRAAVQALVGGVLLGVGLRRRRSSGDEPGTGGGTGTGDPTETDDQWDGDVDQSARDESSGSGDVVSAEAKAHLEQSDVLHQAETNPRGVSEEPDVETETDPDEGDVRFSTDQDEGVGAKPHLDGDANEDPRVPDEDEPVTDDHVDVNLSEAAMADEASEATGPTPEQAYPSREGTDPEPTSEKAPERHAEGAVANPDSEDVEEPAGAETEDEGGGGDEREADDEDAA
jgi:hypothetical protein